MKHTKLFEEFTKSLNEAKGIPPEALATIKGIGLGKRAFNKQAFDSSNGMEMKTFDRNQFKTELSNAVSRIVGFSSFEMNGPFIYFNVSEFTQILIVLDDFRANDFHPAPVSMEIHFVDLFNAKRTITKSSPMYFASYQEGANIIASFLSTNLSAIQSLSNTQDEISLSIRKMYSNADAMKIKKAIRYPGDSEVYAILLSLLENKVGDDRAVALKNAINILNTYLNDASYIAAPQFDSTNPKPKPMYRNS